MYNTRASQALAAYFFSNPWSAPRRHGVQKNGIHYGDNDVPPYDLADSTRLAEAYRLVSAVAAGGRPMFDVKLTPAEDTRIAFAVADDRHAHLRMPCLITWCTCLTMVNCLPEIVNDSNDQVLGSRWSACWVGCRDSVQVKLFWSATNFANPIDVLMM